MIEDGLVERFGIDEFYALHAEPGIEVGKLGFVSGYATANADIFEITFDGKGGHGSRPHFVKDPVIAMAEAILALQTVVSRNTDPNLCAVVSVCCAQSGDPDGTSVVPQKSLIRGTARSYEPEVRDLIDRRIHEIADGIAQTYDMKAEAKYIRLYPAMYNTPNEVAEAKRIAEEVLGAENVGEFPRTMGGEDFANYQEKVPGAMCFLGVRNEACGAVYAQHHNCYQVDEAMLVKGALLHAQMAVDYLGLECQ